MRMKGLNALCQFFEGRRLFTRMNSDAYELKILQMHIVCQKYPMKVFCFHSFCRGEGIILSFKNVKIKCLQQIEWLILRQNIKERTKINNNCGNSRGYGQLDVTKVSLVVFLNKLM